MPETYSAVRGRLCESPGRSRQRHKLRHHSARLQCLERVKGRTLESVERIDQGEVRDIYRERYWDACRCDSLPAPLDWLVFDAAVNQGVQAAGKMLQGAVGVAVDGKIGPATVAAAKRADAEAPARFMTLRAMRYASSPGWVRYGAGWVKRLFMTMQDALRG